ncbi:hypothetical protein F5887DRAFT_1081654 [Amanita rubescens]|nr:hypothetical protein F5887DRAFT_1081654 [Amanita rubescens]
MVGRSSEASAGQSTTNVGNDLDAIPHSPCAETSDDTDVHDVPEGAGDSYGDCNNDLFGQQTEQDGLSGQQANNDIHIDDVEHEAHGEHAEGFNDEENHPLDEIEHNFSQFDAETTIGLDSQIHDIEITTKFIEALKNAKLEDSNMLPDDIARLHAAPSDFPFDVYDPDFLLSLRTFLSVNTASQEVYNTFCDAVLTRHPDNTFLSYDQIKRRIQQITVHSVILLNVLSALNPAINIPLVHVPNELQGTNIILYPWDLCYKLSTDHQRMLNECTIARSELTRSLLIYELTGIKLMYTMISTSEATT